MQSLLTPEAEPPGNVNWWCDSLDLGGLDCCVDFLDCQTGLSNQNPAIPTVPSIPSQNCLTPRRCHTCGSATHFAATNVTAATFSIAAGNLAESLWANAFSSRLGGQRNP